MDPYVLWLIAYYFLVQTYTPVHVEVGSAVKLSEPFVARAVDPEGVRFGTGEYARRLSYHETCITKKDDMVEVVGFAKRTGLSLVRYRTKDGLCPYGMLFFMPTVSLDEMAAPIDRKSAFEASEELAIKNIVGDHDTQ